MRPRTTYGERSRRPKSRANKSMRAWLEWQVRLHHCGSASRLSWEIKQHVIQMGYAHILKEMQ